MSKREHIPADCEFSHLREITDPKFMTGKLQEHLAAAGLEVESCKTEQMYYRRGRDCKLLLKARLDNKRDATRGEQFYFGRILSDDHPETPKIQSMIDRMNWVAPQFGPPCIHIAEWQMWLLAYPNDPNLPGLALMANPQKVLAQMQAAPEKFGLGKREPVGISAKMTKYIPGMRCGYVYNIALAEANGAKAAFSFYGKAYKDDEGEAAYGLMKKIWESDNCQQGKFLLPQPYSYDAPAQIMWQEAITGEPFSQIAETISDLPKVAKEIGQRLAAFHNTSLPLPVEMTFDFQVQEVREAIASVKQTFPEYADSCAEIGQNLLEAATRLGPGPLTPVHASFKFSHIFQTAPGITFIDFDSANLGDPGYDVGRFIAHLHKMKASWKIDPEIADQTIENFCAGYNDMAAASLTPERIDWFTASHVLGSQVYKSVKRLDTGIVNKLLKVVNRLSPGLPAHDGVMKMLGTVAQTSV